jgi:hypothetical protein
MRKIEKITQGLLAISLIGLLIAWVMPEPALSAITVSATVPTTMLQCTTPLDGSTNAFGTIDNTAVYAATTSSTTVQSSGTAYMKVYDSGSGSDPGLYKAPDLIESPDAAYSATATLSAGTEGYGIMASTTGSNLVIHEDYNYASTTNIVGGLQQGSGSAKTVASSSSAVSSEVVNMDYKAAVSITTPGGSYSDSVTISCSTS